MHGYLISLTFISNIAIFIYLYLILKLLGIPSFIPIINIEEALARIFLRFSILTYDIKSFSEYITAQTAIRMI